ARSFTSPERTAQERGRALPREAIAQPPGLGAVTWAMASRGFRVLSEGRWTNGFALADDVAGRDRRRTEDRRRALRYSRHRADRQRQVRGPAVAREGAAR